MRRHLACLFLLSSFSFFFSPLTPNGGLPRQSTRVIWDGFYAYPSLYFAVNDVVRHALNGPLRMQSCELASWGWGCLKLLAPTKGTYIGKKEERNAQALEMDITSPVSMSCKHSYPGSRTALSLYYAFPLRDGRYESSATRLPPTILLAFVHRCGGSVEDT